MQSLSLSLSHLFQEHESSKGLDLSPYPAHSSSSPGKPAQEEGGRLGSESGGGGGGGRLGGQGLRGVSGRLGVHAAVAGGAVLRAALAVLTLQLLLCHPRDGERERERERGRKREREEERERRRKRENLAVDEI